MKCRQVHAATAALNGCLRRRLPRCGRMVLLISVRWL